MDARCSDRHRRDGCCVALCYRCVSALVWLLRAHLVLLSKDAKGCWLLSASYAKGIWHIQQHVLTATQQSSMSSLFHLMLVTQQVGVTRDAATVDAIFDRISRVAVASRSLRCLGSCALNLCRRGFSTLYDWHHCSMLPCTGNGLLGKEYTIMSSTAVHSDTQLHKPSMHACWLEMP